jgi:hypothetical protein
MSAIRGIARRILDRIPLQSRLHAQLNDLTDRIAALEASVSSLSSTPTAPVRDWVHTTVVTNLKDKIAALEERLAECGGANDARTTRQRVRDLEDYMRLGGREPPR